ncbi:unnamed protein product, partial [Ixodes hexagonus]
MSRQGCKWSCQHCTYENWPKALRCTICQKPRPTLIEEEASTEERDIYKVPPHILLLRSSSSLFGGRDELKTRDKDKTKLGDNTKNEPKSTSLCHSLVAFSIFSAPNPYHKWACSKCTYLNWPQSIKCTQCLNPRGPSQGTWNSPGVPSSPPAPSPQATTSAETAHGSSDLRSKWTCHACTYENWPNDETKVQCLDESRTGLFTALSLSLVFLPTSLLGHLVASRDPGGGTAAECGRKWFSSLWGRVLFGKVSRKANSPVGHAFEAAERKRMSLKLVFLAPQLQLSTEEAPLPTNNYLCSLRRQVREADRLWLNACRAVVDGEPEPISRYLSSGGDPGRQLTHGEAGLLARTATFDPGFTLAHMAIRHERDDILALLLSNPVMTHPVAKRVPSDVGRDTAADIRRHITASFKQKKGPFSCYFVTEFVTFALPIEIKEFHPSVQKVLFDELLDQDVQKELEEDSAIINWSLELTETLGSRLYALWNRSAGNCLLDSALQATWGVFDRDNSLRQVLGDSLSEAAAKCHPQSGHHDCGAIPLSRESRIHRDHANLASPQSSLVFWGKAHLQSGVDHAHDVFRKKIGTYYKRVNKMWSLGAGIYIPLLWEPSFCWKSPIALGYTRGHFSALVPMEPEAEVLGGAGALPRDPEDLEVAFLPLMTADRQLLPLHFLTQGEV